MIARGTRNSRPNASHGLSREKTSVIGGNAGKTLAGGSGLRQ
jgi:hypothetical protein